MIVCFPFLFLNPRCWKFKKYIYNIREAISLERLYVPYTRFEPWKNSRAATSAAICAPLNRSGERISSLLSFPLSRSWLCSPSVRRYYLSSRSMHQDRLSRNIEQLFPISSSEEDVTAAVFQDRGIKRCEGARKGKRVRRKRRDEECQRERPRRWENIDAAFMRGEYSWVKPAHPRASERTDRDETQGWDIGTGGNGRRKGRTRYRQLAGSYIELRFGASIYPPTLRISHQGLSPQLSRSSIFRFFFMLLFYIGRTMFSRRTLACTCSVTIRPFAVLADTNPRFAIAVEKQKRYIERRKNSYPASIAAKYM